MPGMQAATPRRTASARGAVSMSENNKLSSNSLGAGGAQIRIGLALQVLCLSFLGTGVHAGELAVQPAIGLGKLNAEFAIAGCHAAFRAAALHRGAATFGAAFGGAGGVCPLIDVTRRSAGARLAAWVLRAG